MGDASEDIDRDDLRSAVNGCGLFDSLDDEQLTDLLAEFTNEHLVTGDVLFHEGDEADAMYIVRHGRLRVSIIDGNGDRATVGEVGKHQVVGEMAVITDSTRSGTVSALRDSDLYRLPAQAFSALIQHHPHMLRPFASVVVDRLRTAMTQPLRPALPATIVVIVLTDLDRERFARDLAEHLAPFRTAVVLPDDASHRPDVSAWLLDVESDVDLSILVADREPTDWTRRCLRHADHVELVVDHTSHEGMDRLLDDGECAGRLDQVPVHLVSMHVDGTKPSTRRWLDRREFASYANLRLGSGADIARLARLITGRANVVVFGGGGARGFAHFGVARALREAGVPIDGIIGASAGAVVGGLLARMPDVDEAQEAMLDWFRSVRWRRDFTPPRLGLTTGRFMTEGLQELGDGFDIEELSTNFAAVSCDLVAAVPYVHDRGPLWQAIRASGSVPGLFPPVLVGDRLLVDGGLVANMPTAIARARHPNATLVAVDVGDPAGIVTGGTNGLGVVNGWERLRHRTTDDTVTLPRLLMRLTELGRDDSTESADIAIAPDVRGFGITETQSALEIIDRGYEAGRAAVESGAFATSST